MAGDFDPRRWAEEHASFFPDRDASDVAAVLELWQGRAAEATGIGDVALAAPLQRHLTARGTGLPSNFALLLTPGEVVAVKFNPRNATHPVEVVSKQFGKRVAAWPRGSVSAGDLEPGRMATGLTLTVAGEDPVPCRTPRLPGNPAAAALVSELGAALPEG